MPFEFDHLFILTEIGAPEAEELVAFGLVEGTSNTHPGQGTANRRFFFHNAMLELLWVHAPAEAKSEVVSPTHLCDRWENRHNGTSPFGIILRPAAGFENATIFSSWAYRPPYLSGTMSIAVGNNSNILTEPMLFQISFGMRPDRFPPEQRQPLEHQVNLREITRVELVTPNNNNPSPELQAVLDMGIIRQRLGEEYCVELGFDGERGSQKMDFRPNLPLIFSW